MPRLVTLALWAALGAPVPAASSSQTSPLVLRFSPRPNRAREIHWRAFGPAAFDESRRSGKPVFLNLAAVWCHWCHVFDETTLSDPQVIALLNERFIPIRVDADQNPQVERRYLLGGWPTNAFLSDDGEVLGGGTYFPPEQWKAIANAVLQGYGGDREQLKESLGGDHPTPHDDLAAGAVDAAAVDRIGAQVLANVDPTWGGFGSAPKFPQGDALDLLAYLAATRHTAGAASAAQSTLAKMRAGQIFDPVEGGFFRYAMREDWSSPHYEKMLQGNAEILLAAADLYPLTADEHLREIAQSIASYLVGHLWDERAGGFYASQDADESYYQLGSAERSTRTPPPIDRTFLADRMAITARALIRAACAFEEPSLASYAQRTLELILHRMRAPDGTVFHVLPSGDGSAALSGVLDDQAQVMLALVDLAGWTGDEAWLADARSILRATRAVLGEEHPGYFDIPASEAGAGLTRVRVKPFDGNVDLAWAMLRLSEVEGDEDLGRQGRELLGAFAGRAGGMGAATFARAADLAVNGGVRLLVVGPAKSPEARGLLAAARSITDPRREVRLLDTARGRHSLGDLEFPSGPPTLYLCRRGACSPPVRDPKAVAAAFTRFSAAAR